MNEKEKRYFYLFIREEELNGSKDELNERGCFYTKDDCLSFKARKEANEIVEQDGVLKTAVNSLDPRLVIDLRIKSKGEIGELQKLVYQEMTEGIEDMDGIFSFIENNKVEDNNLVKDFLWNKLQELLKDGKIKKDDIINNDGSPLGILKKIEEDNYYFLQILIKEESKNKKNPNGTVSFKDYKKIPLENIDIDNNQYFGHALFYPDGPESKSGLSQNVHSIDIDKQL